MQPHHYNSIESALFNDVYVRFEGFVTCEHFGPRVEPIQQDVGFGAPAAVPVYDLDVPEDVTLVGNARLDNEFGISVDGAGDYVTIAPQDYANGEGGFTVSFWFTRQGNCNVENRYEYLYTHVNAVARECPPGTAGAEPRQSNKTSPLTQI